MAQADGVVANGTGSAVRSDINGQYAALWSNHSGSTEPSTGKVAYQFWADTNENILKIRDSSNNSWISLFTLAGGISVDATSFFREDVTFDGVTAGRDVVWDRSDNALEFADNTKATFGNSDLQIYHNSNDSIIKDSGTGDLVLETTRLVIQDVNDNAIMGYFKQDEGVELFFNGSKKISTLSDGARVENKVYVSEGCVILEKPGVHHHRILSNDTGNDLGFQQSSDTGANTNFTTYLRIKDGGDIHLPVDGKKLLLGSGSQLQIYFDGSNSYVQDAGTGALRFLTNEFAVYNAAGDEWLFKAEENGANLLKYDNVTKLATDSFGVSIQGDCLKVPDGSAASPGFTFNNEGSADTGIYRPAANNLAFSTDGTQRMKIDDSGDLFVQRVYDNTTSGGSNVRVQSSGLLQRDTSSRRYKNSITDAVHGLVDLKKLRSVTFKGNNDGDTIFGGLIAEEVHDAGLTEFVDYNNDNQPEALCYGNMVSLCIKAIQELSAEVETLKTKVTALEAA